MRAVIVSVDYSDLLALTLPVNRPLFDEVTVVTYTGDAKTIAVAEANGARVFTTGSFYDDGADFNKWKALEEGLDFVGRFGPLLLLDADIVWPRRGREILNSLPLVPGFLYGPRRRMLTDLSSIRSTGLLPSEKVWGRFPLHPNEREVAGYSQVFFAEDSVLGPPPWHETNWRHAGGADSFFQSKWPNERKVRPPFEVLHLGPAGANWTGRTVDYLDGTTPPGANSRRRKLRDYIAGRRVRPPEDRYGPEKLSVKPADRSDSRE